MVTMDVTDLSALLGEDVSGEFYSDIWVGVSDSGAAALVGEARRLADGLGCYVHAVTPDGGLGDQAVAVGADRVHVVPTAAWEVFLAGQQPEFVFLPVNQQAAAARLAQRLGAGLITDARNLSIDDSSRALLGSHPVYGGDYFLDLTATSAVKMATLDPRFLPLPYPDPSRSGEVVAHEVTPPETLVRDLGPVDYAPHTWPPLTKARVIVAAGNAVRDAEGFALVQQLAERLNAELAGDQSARDRGWVDEAHQVGVTAREVAPDLYVAVGIRGDTLHNAAIAGARQVIAIHPNPDAPIFAVADECVVAQPKEFLPRLLAQLG
jgi:electron transfer flavoprotein alpha subunit